MNRSKLLLLLVLPLLAAQAQDRRPFNATDLWGLTQVGSLALSPDGKTAAVVASTADLKTNKVNGDIYLVDIATATRRQFTTGQNTEGSPVWSPDGTQLAFVTKRETDEKSQIYLISLAGGEARRLTDLPLGASSPKWFPDGKRISFVSSVLPKYGTQWDSLKAELKRRKDSKVTALETEDRVFRYWDHYKVDGIVDRIFSVSIDTKEVTDLTPKMDRWFNYAGGIDFDISPDGESMLVSGLTAGPPYDELYFDIYEIPTDGSGSMKNLTADNPSDDFSPRYSPDGKFMLYGKQISRTMNAERTKLMRRDLSDNSEIELCRDFDRSPSGWQCSADQNTVYFTAEDRARETLYSVPFAGGAVSELVYGGTNRGLELHGTTLVFLRQSLQGPNELYAADTDGKNLRKLTDFNDSKLKEFEMGRVEDVTFTGARGDAVQMYIAFPPGFDPRKKWPLLVLIHGGPHGTFGDDFHPRWNVQAFAAPGYVCITPNFHGSTGFGEEFAECINGAHPEMPYEDIMAATEFMANKPYIDGNRIAAAGGSYGGYMMGWIGGHTDRFKCLINHAGVYNLMAQFGSDITFHRDISYGGTPWHNRDSVLKWSPSQYAERYITPTLVVHGEKDYRVPYGQGLELYGMLKAKNVPAKLIIYPDENHWVLTANNSIHWYGEFHEWLKRWIGAGPN